MRLILAIVFAVSAVAQTTVSDVIYNGSGQRANGVVIYIRPNQQFTASGGQVVAPTEVAVRIVNGNFSVPLYPNTTATPAGTYYLARYVIPGTVQVVENWVVPVSGSPVNLSAVRTVSPPSTSFVVALSQLAQGGAMAADCLIWSGTVWQPSASCGGTGSNPLFSQILTATNTTATMTVGSGATFVYTGTGIINANRILGINLTTLSTGLVKVTNGTGALSTAVAGADYQIPIGANPPLSLSGSTVQCLLCIVNGVPTTWTAGLQDFAAVTMRIPVGAGLAETANGRVGYDSTANLYKFGVNGNSRIVAMLKGAFSNNDCPKYEAASGLLISAGPCASASGITSLNGLTAGTQLFANANDTNVTMSIGSATATHTFTMGWTGTLAKARIIGTAVYNDQANAYSTGLQDFHLASSRLPETTVGALPIASSNTNHVYVVTDGVNASDCSTGSSITRALCISNGSAWVPLGGGSGGSPGTTFFSSITNAGPSNTASETSLIGTVTGSTTIPAGTFASGGVVQVIANGFFSLPTTADALTLKYKCGSTILGTTTFTLPAGALTNGVFRMDGTLTARGAGAGGSFILNSIAEFTGAALAPSTSKMLNTSAVAYDFTTPCVFDVTATWGQATSGESITGTDAAMWIPGAAITGLDCTTSTGGVLTKITSSGIPTCGTFYGLLGFFQRATSQAGITSTSYVDLGSPETTTFTCAGSCNVAANYISNCSVSGGNDSAYSIVNVDGSNVTATGASITLLSASTHNMTCETNYSGTLATGSHTIKIQHHVDNGNTLVFSSALLEVTQTP